MRAILGTTVPGLLLGAALAACTPKPDAATDTAAVSGATPASPGARDTLATPVPAPSAHPVASGGRRATPPSAAMTQGAAGTRDTTRPRLQPPTKLPGGYRYIDTTAGRDTTRRPPAR